MKIASWNLWNKNPNQFASVEFLIDSGADVICLQEVLLETVIQIQTFCQQTSLNHQEQLDCNDQNNNQNSNLEDWTNFSFKSNSYPIYQNLEHSEPTLNQQNQEACSSTNYVGSSETSTKNVKWQIFHALDHRDQQAQHYLVILTKIPVCHHFCDYLDSAPPKSFLAKKHQIQSVRQFHYVDLVWQGTKFRIFNLHLEVAVGPRRRLAQFDNLVKNFGVNNNLICGDFNIFPHPIGSLFVGWAASFCLSDYATNERKVFEIKFKKLNLHNVFAKKITYPKYKLQLDHILIPKNLKVIEKRMEKKLSQSDHLWLFCQIGQ